MKPLQRLVLCLLLGVLIAGCSAPTPLPPPTPEVVLVTATPKIVVITNTPRPTSTPRPSPTPTTDMLSLWETPPAEVLLNYNDTYRHYLPPPIQFTETVEKRKFQFTDPQGFLFANSTEHSAMESKDRDLMLYLEIVDHKGKANALGFLHQMIKNESLFKAVDFPQRYKLAGYRGWMVNIESPGTYETGVGQIIILDIDSSTLFYAIGIAKQDRWKAGGKRIYYQVLESLTFPGYP